METRAPSTSSALGLVLIAVLALGAGAAPYKWVDKDGNVHYSDKPPPGAKLEPVELKPLTEVTSQPVPQSDASSAPAAPAAAGQSSYRSLVITNPADQTTLRDPSAPLSISAKLDPPLGSGDILELTYDGKVVTDSVAYVERGTHTVGARVVGADGSVRIAAAPVTVYAHQTSVPEVTPPKPKPKKKP